jgi:phage terminase large subunit-like protein
MCEDTLRNAGFTGRVIRVHATKGKTIRAEPIAALYELGYVQHKTGLSDAEEEMLDFDPLTGKSNGKSPNRVDWIVWALTELSGGGADLEKLLKMAMGEHQ